MFSILMLDDEPNVLSALRRSLRLPLGDTVKIEQFTDPHDALTRVGEHAFDVVMSDFRMPAMDGIQFLRFVREIRPDALRLIVSASTEVNGVMSAINDIGVFRYIVKPWTTPLLIEDVRAALAQSVANREQRALAEAKRMENVDYRHDAERRRLEELEPGLTHVEWSAQGEVLMPPLHLETRLESDLPGTDMSLPSRRDQIAAALPAAFARRELSFQFQPQVDLRDGTVTGLETLLRWQSDELGPVSPAEFVPIAEASGLLVEIGEWLFAEVCAQSVAWTRAGLPAVRIAVNVSAAQLARPDFAQRMQQLLLSTGADPHNLGIEVVEAALTHDIEHSHRMLRELRALGMEVALDNFGSSASSVSLLRRMPLDLLKIDRTLIHDVTAPPEDVSVTRAMLMLAKGLKLRVVAEGVETEGQLSLLMASGCEVMQGYVFSPPLPAAGIEQMLRDGRRLPDSFTSRTKQRTLLIVDDEENVISSLRRLLRGAGYRILTAASGAEGLARLAEHEVDVIVSDQRMPGMTGVEMLQQAKVLYPDTVRIVLSGYTGLQSITDAVNEGAIYKFLTKPWDDDRLRAHIAEAFMRKEMSDENRRLGADLQAANVELAQANERQLSKLASQHRQLGLEEGRAVHAQDLLEYLPTAAIGIDCDGDVVFVNRQARQLMGIDRPLVGCAAEDVLPARWLEAWKRPGSGHHRVDIDGAGYLLSCASIADRSLARGHLLSLVPDLDIIERSFA